MKAVQAIGAALVLACFASGEVAAGSLHFSKCDMGAGIRAGLPTHQTMRECASVTKTALAHAYTCDARVAVFGAQAWLIGDAYEAVVPDPWTNASAQAALVAYVDPLLAADPDPEDEFVFPIVGPADKRPMIDPAWAALGEQAHTGIYPEGWCADLEAWATGMMYGDRDDDDEPPFPIVGPNPKKPMIGTQWVAMDTMVEWIIDWCSSEVRNTEFAGAMGGQQNIFGHRYLRGGGAVIKMHHGAFPEVLSFGEPELYIDDGRAYSGGWEREAWRTANPLAAHKYDKDLRSHWRGGGTVMKIQEMIPGALAHGEPELYIDDGRAYSGGWEREAWRTANPLAAHKYDKDLRNHWRGGGTVMKIQETIPGALAYGEPVLYADIGMAGCEELGRKEWHTVDAMAMQKYWKDWLKTLKPKK